MTRHALGHAIVLVLLALLSWIGDGWGYFVLYAGVITVLAVVIAATWTVHRMRHRQDPAREQQLELAGRILRSFAYAELTLGAAIVGVVVAARFQSGPIGPFAGGPFPQDAVSELPASLPLLDSEEIQIQIPGRSPYSITTHGFVIDGTLHVGTDFVFPFKRWIHIVQKDPAVLVRFGGNIYAGRVVLVRDPVENRRLLEEVSRQRGVAPDDWLTDVWFFRMEPAS